MVEDIQAKAKSMKTRSIVSICLLFTIIGIVPAIIMAIIDSISILTTDWRDEKLNSDKTLWGILGLVLLGNIATLVFAKKVLNNA